MIARMTSGVSPLALTQAHADWAQHLLLSPDEQFEFVHKAGRKWARFFCYCSHASIYPGCPVCIEPLPQDKRFAGQAWQRWPFNAFYQNFLLTQQWWHNATIGVPGVSRHHEDIVSFLARQALDIVSPANFPFTNPEVIEKAAHQGGMNFVRGALNFWEDWQRISGGDGPVGSEAFKVGRGVAVTPGKVIFRNRVRFKYRAFLSYSHPDTRSTDMTGLQAELEAAFRKLPMDLGPDRQMLEGIVENTVAVEVHFTAVGGFDKSIPLAGHKFRYMAMVFRFIAA